MKNNLHFLICLVSLLLMCYFTQAQTYTMPSSGTNTITTCAGTILDPGGTGNYSNSCNSYLVINSSSPGCQVHLSGSYHTESSFDYFYVYDGTTTNGTQLGYFTGTGTCDVTSQSGALIIYFHTDGSVVYDGFELSVTCVGSCDCGGPYGLVASTGNGTATISWTNPNSPDITGFIVEYGPHGFTPGTGTTQYLTSTSFTVNGLTNGTEYDFYVYYDCGGDHVVTTEIGTMVSVIPSTNINFPTSGSTSIIMCSGRIYDSGGPSGQYTNSEAGNVTIYAENPWCRLSISGSYDTESCCDHIYIYDSDGSTLLGQYQGSGTINLTSTGGSMTISFTSDGSVLYSGFDFLVTCTGTCECGSQQLGNVHAQPAGNGYELAWNEATGDSTIHQYIIEYGLSGFTPGTGTTVIVPGSPYTLTGLDMGATYDFYIWADCNDDGLITTEVSTLYSFCVPESTPCIDFTDLHAPQITCTTGFTNQSGPYATVGVGDKGPASASSQHTIHYLPEPDPRTNNGLITVPPCELYSVRLGNWNTSYGCESISYDFAVDTADADILLLKYAAVLQNPSGHSYDEQPRFDFEILDQNGNQIDPTCGAASFVSGNTTTGWNEITYSGESLFWKDWTYVGFDVSAYHGQTVRVRMTTYDCNQAGHFGYAYFTLNCKRRVIIAESCGEMLSNTYTAPAGFNYAWYYEMNPSQIISHDQSVTITGATGSSVLCCHVSFTENPSCGFELRTTMTARYPLARFAPQRDSCTWSFAMNNTSTITSDGVTPLGNGEVCETAHWDFGDGTTSDEYNPTHEFPGPGVYTVRLISGLAHDQCQDTAYYTVDILSNNPNITGPTDACQHQMITLHGSGGSTYEWYSNGQLLSTNSSLVIDPEETATYTLHSFAADGCEVTVSHDVTVRPTSESALTDEICYGESYNRNGFTLGPQLNAGTFTPQIVLPNQYGCDSTVTLTLTVKPLPNTSLGRAFNHCFEDFGDAVLQVPESDCSSYHWSTGATTQFISVSEGGTYSVTATKDGCENSGEITIYDVCPFNIYLPNCITPTNVDGINDVFCLPTVKDIVEFHIYIFDRWGKLVYTSDDPHFQWDGSINGKIRSNAVYNYRIDILTSGAEKRLLKGTLTVL